MNLLSDFFFVDVDVLFLKEISLQWILRQANFRGAKLLGLSFFDADLTGNASTFSCT